MTTLYFILFGIVVLVIVLFFTKSIRDEGFAMSPGTMDQLNSTRAGQQPMPPQNMSIVPNELQMDTRQSDPIDGEVQQVIQGQLVDAGIHDMTETAASQDASPYAAPF